MSETRIVLRDKLENFVCEYNSNVIPRFKEHIRVGNHLYQVYGAVHRLENYISDKVNHVLIQVEFIKEFK